MFIISGLAEMFLFAVSIFGCVPRPLSYSCSYFEKRLVSVIARNLNLMRIYANTIYVHFPLHLGVTVWFFVVVRVVNPGNSHLCDDVAKQQCLDTSLFWRTAYIVLALLVLLIELCEIPDVYSIFSSH